jgi:hypothetical protein
MTNKRIRASNLPMQPPLSGTLLWYLLLTHFAAPGWVWGVMGTLFAVLWIAFFVGLFANEYVDVLKDHK